MLGAVVEMEAYFILVERRFQRDFVMIFLTIHN